MTSDERDFLNLKAPLKESARRLVAEIVEMKILERRGHSFASALERVRDRRLTELKRQELSEFEGD